MNFSYLNDGKLKFPLIKLPKLSYNSNNFYNIFMVLYMALLLGLVSSSHIPPDPLPISFIFQLYNSLMEILQLWRRFFKRATVSRANKCSLSMRKSRIFFKSANKSKL